LGDRPGDLHWPDFAKAEAHPEFFHDCQAEVRLIAGWIFEAAIRLMRANELRSFL
jgi:hypothetical protein